MPQRAYSPCRRTGCPNLTRKGSYCPGCQKEVDQQDRQRRGSAAERGYGARWAAYSREYRKAHPFCVDCWDKGEYSPSEHVDHIIPVSGPDDPLFWLGSNHAARCKPCHSRKTVVEDKRGLHHPVVRPARSQKASPTANGGAWFR